jgi:organic hydroperoxide reductase OsmC/OhrA
MILTLERREDYEFVVHVDESSVPDFITEEGRPLGKERGPNPEAMLGAATATCLSSSLLFCCAKAHVPIDALTARVQIETARNEHGRLRIGSIAVALSVKVEEEYRERYERCRALFEDYCTVTESIRHGTPVSVTV